jgi:tetratricopeptide (TPR) repeat protein
MSAHKITRMLRCLPPLLVVTIFAPQILSQTGIDERAHMLSSVSQLGLPPEETAHLQQALQARDYIAVEGILLPEIERDPHSIATAHLLAFTGGVYFLAQDYLHAAVAWKKSQAIAPLEPQFQFTLAMAYIRMGHSDWAHPVLESLAIQNKQEALYPYWLGRLAYDDHDYREAIQHFQNAIRLSPDMARAYDNLGLCYYYQNDNVSAIANYKKAIELDRGSPHPSAWPYLNLAITLQFLNQLDEAEINLRESLRLNPNLAEAHFHLGIILDTLDRSDAAIRELHQAADLDPNYAEPHFALAKIYHRLGKREEAQKEVETYLHIHSAAAEPRLSVRRSLP